MTFWNARIPSQIYLELYILIENRLFWLLSYEIYFCCELQTLRALNAMTLPVLMNPDSKWELNRKHLRVAFRRVVSITNNAVNILSKFAQPIFPNSCITLPESAAFLRWLELMHDSFYQIKRFLYCRVPLLRMCTLVGTDTNQSFS